MTIKELRNKLQMTQKDFAAAIKLSLTNYNRLENGHNKPCLTTYKNIIALMEKHKLNTNTLKI